MTGKSDVLASGIRANGLTVDVEEYFQVSNFDKIISRDEWARLPSRVEDSMARILDEMERDRVSGTFFILGWVAARHPNLVRRIRDAGHEVASHGTGHRTVYDLTADQFRRDVTDAKRTLEDIIGEPVVGYRAPSYSITRRSWWALEILAEAGYSYDSSIFPIRHYRYGIPGYQRFPHRIDLGNGLGIWEFPLTTVSFFGFNFPIAGGAYLRFLPGWLVKCGISWVNRKERQPAVIYFHPWEIDDGQPRQKVGWPIRVNHYHNLSRMLGKLQKIWRAGSYRPLREILEQSYGLQSGPTGG
jgi:polysaccharide deacetylase family protein (PEP-CTERM system associated)